jgi:hypothetical protein
MEGRTQGYGSPQSWPDPHPGGTPQSSDSASRPAASPEFTGAPSTPDEAELLERLRRTGWTEEQIARLELQRRRWQHLRAVRACEGRGLNFQRLCFVRWLVQHGHLSEHPRAPKGPADSQADPSLHQPGSVRGLWQRLRSMFRSP